MILTLTPNPSIDQTLVLPETLRPGTVQRAESVSSVAGGKGINVSQACVNANVETLAVFPCGTNDPFLRLVEQQALPYLATPIAGTVRTNTTVTSPTGETTKLNGPGPTLSAHDLRALQDSLLDAAPRAHAIVLAGSLPQGIPVDWYVTLTALLREAVPNTPIAIDTSDAPLRALYAGLDSGIAPDIIKPNGEELGQMLGIDGQALEDAAARGNFEPIVAAARRVVERGIAEVLVTLGAAGAVLVTAEGAFQAYPPPITCVSTVGAGDSTLASYVLSRTMLGCSFLEALEKAVAYGAAAASLPGTVIPSPHDVNFADTISQTLSF